MEKKIRKLYKTFRKYFSKFQFTRVVQCNNLIWLIRYSNHIKDMNFIWENIYINSHSAQEIRSYQKTDSRPEIGLPFFVSQFMRLGIV